MKNQDKELGVLECIKCQKEIAQVINKELDSQNKLLEVKWTIQSLDVSEKVINKMTYSSYFKWFKSWF
jgi:hypothetical protein